MYSLEQAHGLLERVRLKRIEFAIKNEERRVSPSYLTVSQQDNILQIDLGAALLLDAPRLSLRGQVFRRFIAGEEQSQYFLSRKYLRDTGVTQACQVRMERPNRVTFWAHLELSKFEGEVEAIRIAIRDITERNLVDLALKDKERELRDLLAKEGAR